MKEIRKESTEKNAINIPEGATSNRYIPLENERGYVPELTSQGVNSRGKEQSAFTKRIKKSAWIVFAVGILSMIIYSMGSTSKSVDTSEEAASALETHISTSLAAGTILLESDENYVGGDMTTTHESTDDETTLYIWDYVQILVNGMPLSEPFMITNKLVQLYLCHICKIHTYLCSDIGCCILIHFRNLTEGKGISCYP